MLLTAVVYYACQPHLAASTASQLMAAPDIAMVRHAWSLLDTALARRVVTDILPALGRSPRLAVLREIQLVDADTLQRLSHERSSGRGSSSKQKVVEQQQQHQVDGESRYEVRLSPTATRPATRPLKLSDSCIRLSPRKHPRRYQRVGSSRLHESLSSSLDDADDMAPGSDSTLRLLLLSARSLHLSVNLRFHRVPSVSHFQPARPVSSAVVLYLHGGGFFADFQASHLHFLSQWSSDLGLPIVYVNYSLAPDNAYPTALNECYDAYRWLLEGRLGLNADRIILVGDSTGGNLAAGCCMKAIQDKLRVPDAVILACPILNLRLTPTPSRSLYMMDAVLPMNLLLACRSLYLASPAAANDADIDPCMTGDHRVLTSRGWKSIKEVKLGDEVLSFDYQSKDDKGKHTWAQEWKPVTAKQCFPIDSANPNHKLYRMQGNAMDVIATHDHRMLVAHVDDRSADGLHPATPVGYSTVGELLPRPGGGSRPGVSYADNQDTVAGFKHSGCRLVVRAGHNTQPDIKIVIPKLEKVCEWWWEKDRQRGFLQFIGFWLGDGNLFTPSKLVVISQRKKEPRRWLEEELLPSVFPNWWYKMVSNKDKRGVTWKYYIRCPPLYNYLRLMASGPPGYNPRQPAQLASYPHFTYEWTLAASEHLSAYGKLNNTRRWKEDDMLAQMTGAAVPSLPLTPTSTSTPTSASTSSRGRKRRASTSSSSSTTSNKQQQPRSRSRRTSVSSISRNAGQDDAVCQECGSSDSDEKRDAMLLCDGTDGCLHGCHVRCLRQAKPKGDWFCNLCAHAAPSTDATADSSVSSSPASHLSMPPAGLLSTAQSAPLASSDFLSRPLSSVASASVLHEQHSVHTAMDVEVDGQPSGPPVAVTFHAEVDEEEEKEHDAAGWQCTACTFIQSSPSARVCEMCGGRPAKVAARAASKATQLLPSTLGVRLSARRAHDEKVSHILTITCRLADASAALPATVRCYFPAYSRLFFRHFTSTSLNRRFHHCMHQCASNILPLFLRLFLTIHSSLFIFLCCAVLCCAVLCRTTTRRRSRWMWTRRSRKCSSAPLPAPTSPSTPLCPTATVSLRPPRRLAPASAQIARTLPPARRARSTVSPARLPPPRPPPSRRPRLGSLRQVHRWGRLAHLRGLCAARVHAHARRDRLHRRFALGDADGRGSSCPG